MSDVIHLLPDHIANQIAAGEVIQRPASVVKELMENAVDAGAEHLAVIIKDGGRTLIQVVDDGKGMSETDARMAFERHATSKISNVQDLFSLYTMGFRGEALASIAAVAQVELRTRLRGNELGTRLSIAGSTLESIEDEACAEGSAFSVKNLFYNVPARRKFLKSNETEFRNILTEFERVALVNPDIACKLYHNDTEIFNLPVSGLRQRVVGIFGKRINQRLLSFELETSTVALEGFIGRADATKKKGALNYFFVNGRYMRHPYFHRAVMQAYEPLTPAGETPDYFIYLTIDPATIDVNIHPTKTEIKFEHEQVVWQILHSVVRETLGKANAMPSIDFDRHDAIEMPVYNPANRHTVQQPRIAIDPQYNPFRTTTPQTSDKPLESYDWEQLYRNFETDRPTPTAAHATAETPPAQPENAALFDDLAPPCFQYRNRYIITPLKSGLVLIDQHRAHIRILYDNYLNQAARQQSVAQQLLFPEVVELTPAEASLLASSDQRLRQAGFDLAPIGHNAYAINALPTGTQDCNPATLVKQLLHHMMEHDNAAATDHQLTEALAQSLAEAAAIPAGKKLTVDEMEAIVAALFSSGATLTPDGKNILFLLSDAELERRFR